MSEFGCPAMAIKRHKVKYFIATFFPKKKTYPAHYPLNQFSRNPRKLYMLFIGSRDFLLFWGSDTFPTFTKLHVCLLADNLQCPVKSRALT